MAHPPPPSKRAKPGFATWLALGNILLTLVLTVFVVQWRGESAEEEQARAREAVTGLARTLAQSVTDDLARVDGVLRSAVAAYARDPNDLETMLADLRAGLVDGEALFVTDASGAVRLGLPKGSAPASLADRDFFVAARTAEASALPVVSKPWQGTATGGWGLSVARPLRGADGLFRGTVHAMLGSESLARRLAGVPLAPDGVAALRTADLVLVARVTSEGVSTDGIGSNNASTGLKAAVAREPSNGHIVSRSPRDGVVRGVAYQRVAGFPLYVIAAQGTGDAFADAVAKQ